MSTEKITIQLLKGAVNYASWAADLKLVLRYDKKWSYIEGANVSPPPKMIPDPDGREIENPMYDTWDHGCATVLYRLILNCEDEVKSHICHLQTPAEVWNTLQDMYEPRGASTQYFIAEKIFSATLSQYSSVSTYIASVQTAATEYVHAAARGHAASMTPIPSHLLVLRVLHGLPPTYCVIQTTLLASGEELTMERVKTALMQEERWLVGSSGSRDTSSALQITSRRCGQPKTPEEKARYASWLATAVCHACGKTGHIQTTCPMKTKATPETVSSPAAANLAAVTDNPIVADVMMVQAELPGGDTQMVIADAGNAKAYTAGGESCSPKCWVIDSGCSEHMDPSTENFISYSEYKEPRFVRLANRALVPALGFGTDSLDTRVGNTRRCTELQGVLHVPALANALLSVRTLNRRRLGVNFQSDQRVIIHSSGQIIGESAPDNGTLYELHLWSAPDAMANIAQRTLPTPSFDLLHKRLAHPSHGVLRQMIEKGLVKGISNAGNIPDTIHCDACVQSKMTAAPFAVGHKRADKILERVHSDLGEFEHLSIGGCKYFGLIVDDKSTFLWVQPMKHKGDFIPWFVRMDKVFHN
jgi:hypothetical protein